MGMKKMKNALLKFTLFILYLAALLKLLDAFQGQLLVQALLLIVLSFVYAIIEAKLIYYFDKIIQQIGRRKR
ncbi:hypothetical protein BC351_38580 [Paenibacillus ferrarius]|uniref:Uncharacterized protein n=1 Tax=Paenibacillus ferrarius TaxID=1469647 RepID=A0A1V4H9N0_9BACL|nr:hypothetical protein [Paenibacillus ferrarius]OPH48186.1 hypothetical protein BC351_38580 [Paenibacillus ferrarius]